MTGLPNIRYNRIPESVYRDVAFDNPSNQIRLVRVLALEPTISCKLEVASLRQAPPFSALSYTWRNALHPDPSGISGERSEVVFCNGKRCRLLENLYEALRQLGQHAEEPFWIDAICTNQQDTEEKTSQVQLMSDIYQAATKVHIWLGRSDTDTADAIQLIEHLELLQTNELASIALETLESPAAMQLLDNEYHHRRYWVALARLLRRTWFSRAWVVQEVILARPRGLLVHCGEHSIAWTALRSVSGYLCKSPWRHTFADPDFLGDNLLPPRLNAAAKIGGTQDDIARMTQASFSGEPHDLFLDTLIRVREFDCERRRDKAYCCYGVGMRYRPRDFPFPRPDYDARTSDAEAFTQTARAVLQMSQSLHLLAYAESLRSEDLDGKDNMPSWAPDWSAPEKVGLGITGYRRYWAAGNLMQVVSFADEPHNRVLKLRAAKIDEVRGVGDSKKVIAEGGDTNATLDVLRQIPSEYPAALDGRAQVREEVLWRTLVFDTCPGDQCPAGLGVGEQFRPWLQTRRGEGGNQIAGLLDDLANAEVNNPPSATPSSSVVSQVEQSDFDNNFALRTRVKLFSTRVGRLGAGAEAIRPGDSIWIVPGSRVPLVLRQPIESSTGPSDRYILVGAAYIHGIMHGEAFRLHSPLDFGATIDIV